MRYRLSSSNTTGITRSASGFVAPFGQEPPELTVSAGGDRHAEPPDESGTEWRSRRLFTRELCGRRSPSRRESKADLIGPRMANVWREDDCGYRERADLQHPKRRFRAPALDSLSNSTASGPDASRVRETHSGDASCCRQGGEASDLHGFLPSVTFTSAAHGGPVLTAIDEHETAILTGGALHAVRARLARHRRSHLLV